jgi:hypothetical protein
MAKKKKRKKAFQKAMRAVESKLTSRIDASLVDLRELYESLDKKDRRTLRDWMELVFDAHDATPVMGPLMLRLKLNIQNHASDADSIQIPIPAVKMALECWDRGENYTPTKLHELVG